jgi:hypothetical protein
MLVNLMQREEVLLREGKQCRDISREVENALNQETKSFFTKMSASNKKRWQFLLHKAQKDKEELLDMVRDKCAHDFTGDDHILDDDFAIEGSSKSEGGGMSGRKNKYTAGADCISPLDIEIESLRLEEDYNKNWLDIESFHIQEAFKSQKERIDSEWAIHFDRLSSQYEAKRHSIIGKQDRASSAGGGKRNGASTPTGHSKDGRWQHPEKQKTLIHTAPVFSPVPDSKSSKGGGKMAVGSGVRAVRTKGNGISVKEQAEVCNIAARRTNNIK